MESWCSGQGLTADSPLRVGIQPAGAGGGTDSTWQQGLLTWHPQGPSACCVLFIPVHSCAMLHLLPTQPLQITQPYLPVSQAHKRMDKTVWSSTSPNACSSKGECLVARDTAVYLLASKTTLVKAVTLNLWISSWSAWGPNFHPRYPILGCAFVHFWAV